MKSQVLLVSAVALSILGSYAGLVMVPADPAMGELYRILYVHVPSAWVCYVAFTTSLAASILFLRNRRERYDTFAGITAVIGLAFGAVALITGSIWAKATWGSYWNWDPRETTTLILWIAYLGYISLRLSIGDDEKRRVLSAVYNILAFLTVPLSYASITLVPTLHPQIISQGGVSITPVMLATLLVNVLAATLLALALFLLASEVGGLEERLEEAWYTVTGEGGGA
jgi:heme exporter protein C